MSVRSTWKVEGGSLRPVAIPQALCQEMKIFHIFINCELYECNSVLNCDILPSFYRKFAATCTRCRKIIFECPLV